MVQETPCLVPVRLVCPECDQALQVDMLVTSVLTVETDEEGLTTKVLAPKVKRQTISHRCNQSTLDDAVQTFRDRVPDGTSIKNAEGAWVDVKTGEVLQ